MDAVAGRGKSLRIQKLAKASSGIAARIEEAARADRLDMVEEIAAASLLARLLAALADKRIDEEFADRLAISSRGTQQFFWRLARPAAAAPAAAACWPGMQRLASAESGPGLSAPPIW